VSGKTLIFVLLIFFVVHFSILPAPAVGFVGEGNGPTREAAKREALSDLSQSIATKVKSAHTR
jgi:hypothetical protein